MMASEIEMALEDADFVVAHPVEWSQDKAFKILAQAYRDEKAALAKRDQEAMMLREAISKIQLEAFGEDGSGDNCIPSLEDDIHQALSSTAHLGARYKAELLRAEVKGAKTAMTVHNEQMIKSLREGEDSNGAEDSAYKAVQAKVAALTKEAESMELK